MSRKFLRLKTIAGSFEPPTIDALRDCFGVAAGPTIEAPASERGTRSRPDANSARRRVAAIDAIALCMHASAFGG